MWPQRSCWVNVSSQHGGCALYGRLGLWLRREAMLPGLLGGACAVRTQPCRPGEGCLSGYTALSSPRPGFQGCVDLHVHKSADVRPASSVHAKHPGWSWASSGQSPRGTEARSWPVQLHACSTAHAFAPAGQGVSGTGSARLAASQCHTSGFNSTEIRIPGEFAATSKTDPSL